MERARLSFYLHEEIGPAILNEAAEVELSGKRIDEGAKADPLHQPRHLDGCSFDHRRLRRLYERARSRTTALRLTEALVLDVVEEVTEPAQQLLPACRQRVSAGGRGLGDHVHDQVCRLQRAERFGECGRARLR